jgi:CheY-like chemotaxis protein
MYTILAVDDELEIVRLLKEFLVKIKTNAKNS